MQELEEQASHQTPILAENSHEWNIRQQSAKEKPQSGGAAGGSSILIHQASLPGGK
jgi:hypothetical protein